MFLKCDAILNFADELRWVMPAFDHTIASLHTEFEHALLRCVSFYRMSCMRTYNNNGTNNGLSSEQLTVHDTAGKVVSPVPYRELAKQYQHEWYALTICHHIPRY